MSRDPYYSAEQFQPKTELQQKYYFEPETLLEVLKDNFNDISKGHSKIQLHDLELYAENGKDPKVREVAKVAAENFNEFSGLAHDGKKANAVTKDDLKKDIALVSDHVGGMILAKQIGLGAETLGLGASFVLTGAVCASNPEIPPLALGAGALMLASLAGMGRAEFELFYAGQKIEDKAFEAKETVQQWLRFP